MPKVSICVPAYGNPEGIRRLLESIKAQRYQDYEVVVTDDSPDESVCEEVRRAGIPALRYQKNRVRLGASGNWNEAVRLAKGEYIKMMHHDDWFADRDSLERFAGLLEENPDALLAFSGTWQVTLPEGSRMSGGGSAPGEGGVSEKTAGAEGVERFARSITAEHEALIRQDWRNLFLGNYIGAPSATIYRRNPETYEEGLTWVMDMEYYMRLLRRQPDFVCTTDPLVCIGVSDGQLTQRCKTDGELNVFEYGFLFEKFGLGDSQACRQKLIAVALSYDRPYSAVQKYGITGKEYRTALHAKRRKDFLFLLGVAKRKLLGRK